MVEKDPNRTVNGIPSQSRKGPGRKGIEPAPFVVRDGYKPASKLPFRTAIPKEDPTETENGVPGAWGLCCV